jgi:hypothetical protein
MTRLLILFAELFTLPMRLTSPFNRAARRIFFNLSVPLYAREHNLIRQQVSSGRRCCRCLRPFNAGERKHFEPNLNLMTCTMCQERDHAEERV